MLILMSMKLISACQTTQEENSFCMIAEPIILASQKEIKCMTIETKREILNHNQKIKELCH